MRSSASLRVTGTQTELMKFLKRDNISCSLSRMIVRGDFSSSGGVGCPLDNTGLLDPNLVIGRSSRLTSGVFLLRPC